MNLKSKKIIAREFVLFVCCVIIVLIAFILIFPYNYYYNSKKEGSIKEQIALNKRSDSLIRVYENKETNQIQFTTEMNRIYFEPELSTVAVWTVLYKAAKTDSITYRWNNKWDSSLKEAIAKCGFSNPKDFKNFILANIITKTDIDNKNSVNELRELSGSLQERERHYQNRLLDSQEKSDTLYFVFLLAFLLFLFHDIFTTQ